MDSTLPAIEPGDRQIGNTGKAIQEEYRCQESQESSVSQLPYSWWGRFLQGTSGLTSVLYPDGPQIAVPISGTQRAPAAQISAKVKHQSGQSAIEIQYAQLPPAVLFGGDIVVYVVWTVAPDGTVENLGGIANSVDKGTASFSTAKREFALMITAEPIVTVPTPGELVVFFSGTPAAKDVKPTGFTFGGLSDRKGLIKSATDSIAGTSYKPDKKNPLELIQAEKAVELLNRFDAKKYDAATYDKAVSSLAEAREAKGQKQMDASKVTVTLAGQALVKTVQMKEAEAASKQAAESAASKQNLSASLETTQAELATATAALAAAQAEVKSLSAKNAALSGQQKSLDQTLTGALGQMASGTKTDRGYVVSLSGVAFQSGQSQLSTEAKYVLAKLSGMLLAFPAMTMSVEGHTDSTGSDEANRKLSQARAEAVVTFISEMGVPKSSMTATGFGPDKPVAPNDTEGGRAKNRRVDIVLSEK